MFGTAILWTHAIAGALWLGASASFTIAGLALVAGSEEQRSFVERGAGRINACAMLAAVLLVITGMLNLGRVFQLRAGSLSHAFLYVLGVKIVLYIAMLMTLGVAMRAIPAMRFELGRGIEGAAPRAMRTMLRVHIAILSMGGIAMILGLWLVGS
ncbi:MAG: hypothetical protein Q7S58_08220 [Candidatus Binatus sp.]|uniref:hypothetical protein n=1 Tax=Candidatus Binatus sp. TaxID=2811406 RepID=UPI002724AB95|nr:hypothetical protein [Candidatus Binatus sp.]MDO8432376.1 hypothetical protein [Candidatus Binatus sp.]